ncbi:MULTISPECIES: MFS transporter [unclassified Aureimonas]|uniref:MFS transporter n=1 Tax=unclassified Aureimonas TaxID=2615206 RepID=UPI0006FFA491|nr:MULTISPECIES: MFS transporter [unclassified Aureimonas]KQT52606.1 MFS transporter [Aureimonas sp. Leaf427]KQT77494.1 MFS transporter [Aureimonas sp. Leaf460]
MADIERDRRGPLRRGAVRGWIGFDIAAQPFFTVVITFVFGPYVVASVAENPAAGQAAWGLAATVAGLLIAMLSPVLGAIADRVGPRKPWIAGFAALKIGALCLLWFAAPGAPLLPVLALVVIAQASAEFSIVFNDAMLPSLVAPAEIGRVSNVAWGLGYAGGMVFLMATLAFLAADAATGRTIIGIAPLFGLDPASGEGARATAPLAALWYLLLLLPMMLLTPDRATRSALGPAVRGAMADLLATGREARRRPALFRFLVARMIYQDGVNALLILGGTFAAVLFGWTITESGLFGILLNVAAIVGCLVAGRLDQRLGPKPVVATSIAILLVATLGIVSTSTGSTLFGLVPLPATPFTTGLVPAGEAAGLFATPAEKAYLLWGSLIGLAFGPVQASSRSWLARSIAPEEAGRFFGFYALTGRATSFVATLSVSALTAAALPFTDAESAARIGMSVLVAFFAVGLLALLATPAPASLPLEPQEAPLP